jgi:hypothetical protein
MWLIDPTTGGSLGSDVELGWNVDPTVNDDLAPHLFIFRFDASSPTCYNTGAANGCRTAFCLPGNGDGLDDNGWQQVSNTEAPGEAVTPGTLDTYEVAAMGTNWWVLHDGTWLGYYADCAWQHPITGIPVIEAGGEVYSNTNPLCIPTDMGDGLSGALDASADEWTGLQYQITGGPVRTIPATMTGESDDLGSQYSIGQYVPSDNLASQFSYGGGVC